MHAIALSTTDTFQTIDQDQLNVVSGGYSLEEAVDAGIAQGPRGEQVGKDIGPLVGAGVGAVGGGLTAGPLGAVGGGLAGAKIGKEWGGEIGRGVGFGAGFIGNTVEQLRR
jgi:hypothetical protein